MQGLHSSKFSLIFPVCPDPSVWQHVVLSAEDCSEDLSQGVSAAFPSGQESCQEAFLVSGDQSCLQTPVVRYLLVCQLKNISVCA